MRVVIQRSLESKVIVNNHEYSKIDRGLVLLVSFRFDDTIKDVEKMVKKVLNIRLFEDESKVMNYSVKDLNYEILSVSQFTLYGNTQKGNRPSYSEVMKSDEAKILYEKFNELLQEQITLKTGIFKEDMLLEIKNDGPVTIILESR